MISTRYEYSTLITIHRLLSDKTLRDMAKEIGVSHVQIRRYEKGLDSIPQDKLVKFYEVFNIDLIENEVELSMIQNQVDICFEKIFYRTLDYKVWLAELEENKASYLSSFYCHWYILICFICHLFLNNEKEISYYLKVLDNIELLGFEKQTYYHYKAIREYKLENYKESLEYFNKALNISNDDKLQAMICYSSSILLADIGEYYEAIERLQQALLTFSIYGITSRIINSNMELGNIYLKTRRYKKALEKYLDVQQMMISNNNSEQEIFSIEYNIALTNIYLKEYQAALEILDRYYEKDPTILKIILLHAMCYVMMDDFVNATIWIKRGLGLTNKDMTEYYIFKIYKIVITGEKTKLALETIIKYYHKIEDRLSSDQKYNYLTWIIEIAEARDDYRTASNYLKKKMEFM